MGSESASGQRAVRVFLKTGRELANLLASERFASTEPSRGHTGVQLGQGRSPLVVHWEMSHGVAAWLDEMAVGGGVFEFRPDIVITSIAPELDLLVPPEAEAIEGFKSNARALIEKIRQRSDASILWCNTTTVGRATEPTNHHRVNVEPRSLRAHRLCLALVELSHELGISIIDVDRVLAEDGLGLDGEISGEADRLPVIREETLRVIEDYGYFDDRPITAQLGRLGVGAGD